ncbi:Cellulose synthase-like protein G3 [Morella rubra]|uniref:Cellulose synthase-like protein G3 n=1 Tax=Morella rubra TaxID=262757 RepID=A0A6A1VKY2_9ROSI|nr:Cellulose synthase-like protein G3 [Morella rubra]
MEGLKGCTTHSPPPLHTSKLIRRTPLNRVFALVYTCAIIALLYHHALELSNSTTLATFLLSIFMFIADVVFAFMWATAQSFRMKPILREEFPENLEKVITKASDFPAIDVFICTADPYKEPPIGVVNTALSVLAYDYPTEKISVYISDDGGSQLTLFAFMEAAKFATHWLPFCRKKNVVERSPDVFFASDHPLCSETEEIKSMYYSMEAKVENILLIGKVEDQYIESEQQREAFNKWTDGFTRHDHPTVIQVLLERGKDKDITDHGMPNLIYVSREKSRTSFHNFKAGALNVLLRVSAIMTNAPIVLTQDCDMYSNDPQTARRALCYLSDPKIQSNLGYIQFPQRFYGLNKNDIYACELKRLFQINPIGMDGLSGPNYVGTGCFFSRRVFFGGPSTFVPPTTQELSPKAIVDKPIQSQPVLAMAHHVAGCNYEKETKWGSKWRTSTQVTFETQIDVKEILKRSIFCHPDRAAFYGDSPINLVDMLNQSKRWAIGLLEVGFSKHSPSTFGAQAMGPLMGLAYAHYAFWPLWSIPTTIYAFLPQLALLNGISIFPRVLDQWFLLYAFLFFGAYMQDFLDFFLAGGSVQNWWNDQRIWMVKGLSCLLFGLVEYLLKSLGISTQGFNLTSKVVDDEQRRRSGQGVFEFGVASPLFVPLTAAAIMNLVSFFWGVTEICMGRNWEGLFGQMFIAGFVTVNCWPVYDAMFLRSDKGRMHTKTTKTSSLLVFVLYIIASLTLRS